MQGSFDARLERLKQHLLDRFNRTIFDAPYSVDGYTSRAQADDLGAVLDLGVGDRLLDIGAGDGWPGAYLGDRTGCAVVTTDLEVDSLRRAPRRPVVAASGRHLPFAAGHFEAVVHADVLC
jgi:Methyltransferase domain